MTSERKWFSLFELATLRVPAILEEPDGSRWEIITDERDGAFTGRRVGCRAEPVGEPVDDTISYRCAEHAEIGVPLACQVCSKPANHRLTLYAVPPEAQEPNGGAHISWCPLHHFTYEVGSGEDIPACICGSAAPTVGSEPK